MRKVLVILFIALQICFVSCEKDALTVPVSVDMSLSIGSSEIEYLEFTQGRVYLSQIVFRGHRNQGSDVHFSTQAGFPIGPEDFYLQGEEMPMKRFDIPQGVYNFMEWQLQLEDMSEIESEEDGPVDLLEELDGGLLFKGSYIRLDGTVLPLFVAVGEEEQFNVVAETEAGHEDVTLVADQTHIASLLFNPSYAFKSISRASLEDAEVSQEDGISFIEISNDENEELYEHVLYRLHQSTKVIMN